MKFGLIRSVSIDIGFPIILSCGTGSSGEAGPSCGYSKRTKHFKADKGHVGGCSKA